METITENATQTQNLGEQLAKDLLIKDKGVVICLYGDLGSGKTTFLQGFAKGLGIKKRVLSPTFIVMRTYPLTINHESSIINFYHLDLYRIANELEAETLGLKEIIESNKNIVAIEWPEKIESLLPANCIKIKFEYLGEEKRRITIN